MMAILVVPLVSSLVVGFAMYTVIGSPVREAMAALSEWLKSMSTANAIILGAILGMMQAFDMGGPVDKAAYTFSVAMISEGIFTPIAAAMVGGMCPPIALSLASLIKPKKFSLAERRHARAAWVMGLSYITEGAIPFAAADPLHVIPCDMLGSAVAGGLSMAFGCALRAPHGGIFVLPLIEKPAMYVLALVAGVICTTLALIVFKRDVEENVGESADADSETIPVVG